MSNKNENYFELSTSSDLSAFIVSLNMFLFPQTYSPDHSVKLKKKKKVQEREEDYLLENTERALNASVIPSPFTDTFFIEHPVTISFS